MKLDLFTGREPHIIELEGADGQKAEYKIASDFTVEEFERIYELESQIGDEAKFEERWSIIYTQLLIAFRRYNPDFTVETLKKMFTRRELLKVINFLMEHTFNGMSEKKEDGSNVESSASKKKDQVKP